MVADCVHDYSAALLCAGMKDFTKLHLEGVLSFTQGFELSKNFFHTLTLSLRRSGSNIMHLKGSSSSISSSKDPNTQAKWIVTGSYDTVTSQGDLLLVNEEDSSDVIRLEFIAYENGRFFVPSGEYTGSFQKV